MLVYHGSDSIFTEFDLKFHSSGFYPGIYTTTDQDRAREFGSILYILEIIGEYFEMTPEISEKLQKQVGTSGSGSPVVALLKEQGYSGIIRGTEYLVFDPKDIRIISQENNLK